MDNGEREGRKEEWGVLFTSDRKDKQLPDTESMCVYEQNLHSLKSPYTTKAVLSD